MSLSWVQLSDLHFGQGKSANATLDKSRVLEKLLDDAAHVRKNLGAPDYLLVTGDVAFSGKRAEFETAREWIGRLIEHLEIGLDRVLLVPGNHDVDRARARDPLGRSIHLQMRSDPDLLSNLLAQDQASVIWPKLNEYQSFAAGGFGAGAILPRTPYWRVPLRDDPTPVCAVGLNSALQCFDDDDDNKTQSSGQNLQLSRWQLDRAFKDCPKDALLMVLLHHPPELLRDQQELFSRLSGRPFVLFHGHVHRQRAFEIRSLGNRDDHLCFIAGAGHDLGGEQTHAYAWGVMNEDGLQWYPRQWSDMSGSFVGAGLDARDDEVRSRESVGLYIARSRKALGRTLAQWAGSARSRGSSSVGVPGSPSPFDPLPFPGAGMTAAAMAQAAFRLCQAVARYQYDPDVLIGMNQGGLVVAVAMTQLWHNARIHLGGAFCVKRSHEPHEIRFISLPGRMKKGGRWTPIRPKRILVVDTKFKSGGSVKAIYDCLRGRYGEDVEIRFAVALTYVGWPGRWKRPDTVFPWPAKLSDDDRIKAYVAYYTEKQPGDDDVKEWGRPGWEWEWDDSSDAR